MEESLVGEIKGKDVVRGVCRTTRSLVSRHMDDSIPVLNDQTRPIPVRCAAGANQTPMATEQYLLKVPPRAHMFALGEAIVSSVVTQSQVQKIR